MKNAFEKIQTLQISYEIANAIGNSLELEEMLKTSLSTILKKYSCAAGAVFHAYPNDNEKTIHVENCFTIPRYIQRNETFQTAQEYIPHLPTEQTWHRFQETLPIVEQATSGHFFHVLALPGFGFMILIKGNSPIEQRLLLSLKPLQSKLATACNACISKAQLQQSQRELEVQIQKGVRELEVVTQVSVAASTAHETETLLQNVVDLTKERFDLYHTHIYLFDKVSGRLELAAAAGRVGQQMLRETRYINPDSARSLVGRAFRTGESVIVNNVTADPGFLPHPLLPQTRSEMAVPIISGKETLGVLDVQAAQKDLFTHEDARIFTALARQVGVAIQNARLFEQSERTLQELNEATQRLTRDAWQGYMDSLSETSLHYGYEQNKLYTLDNGAVHEETADSLHHPITIQNAQIGKLALAQPEELKEVAADVLDAVGDRLSSHIENLRLTRQAEQALHRTKSLYEASRTLLSVDDLRKLLQGVVDGIVEALPADRTALITFDTDAQEVINSVAAGPGKDNLVEVDYDELWQGLSGWVLRNEKPALSLKDKPDPRESPEVQQRRAETNSGAIIVVPLRSRGKIMGIITAINRPDQRNFTEEDVDLMVTLASQAAIAIDNRLLFERTQEALADTEEQATRLELLNKLGAELSTAMSLQDIYRAAATNTLRIVNGDRINVTLLNQEKQTLQVYALNDEDGAVPVGASVSVEGTAVGECVHQNRLLSIPVTKESDYTDSRQMAQQGISSTILVPLQSQSSGVIGTLNVGSYASHAFDVRDKNMLRQIGTLLASTIETQNLFTQTEAALSETAALYNVSAQLNAATTLQGVIEAAAKPALEAGAAGGCLFTFETDKHGQPEWAEVAAHWGPSPDVPVGTRIYLPEFAVADLWLRNPGHATLIDDVTDDGRLDDASRQWLETIQTKALILMALMVGNRFVGLVSLHWEEPATFEETDHRLFNSLTAQTAVAVDNILLLEETQQRAGQLGKLTEIEALLSQANSVNDILTIVSTVSKNPDQITLHYVETDSEDIPLTAREVRRWPDGKQQTSPDHGVSQPVDTVLAAERWIKHPNNTLLIDDVEEDDRLDKETRQTAVSRNIRSLSILPLHSGGRWQGVIIMQWRKRHNFSEDETFLFRQLSEPIAAVVASQRALATTETLYQASAALNAVRNYDDILATLRDHTILGRDANLVSLNSFDRSRTEYQEPDWIRVLAYWSAVSAEEEMMEYRLSDYPSADKILHRDEPTIIEDVETDPRLDESARRLFSKSFGAKSVLFAPLVVSGEWIGYIFAAYQERQTFPKSGLRRLHSLAGQAATAVQSINLLRRTEQQLSNLTTIQKTTSQLTAVTSFNEAVKRFLTLVSRSLEAESVNMYRLDDDIMTRIGAYPQPANQDADQTITLTDYPLAREVAEAQIPKSVSSDDPDLHPRTQEIFTAAHITTNVTIPLTGRQGVYGILSVNRKESRMFTETEVNLLQTLADQAMVAFERVQLLEETARRAQREQRIREITGRVRSSIDVDTIMRTAVQDIGRLLGRQTFIYLNTANDDKETAESPLQQPEIQEKDPVSE